MYEIFRQYDHNQIHLPAVKVLTLLLDYHLAIRIVKQPTTK